MAGREEPPILTRVESEVMGILWEKGSASVHDVVAAMPRELAYTSLLTVLRILVKKGYVQHEPHPDGGRAHLYRPLVPATRARRQHVRDLVERLFGGQSEELLVGLLEDEQWSRSELERLRGVIDERLGSRESPSGAADAKRPAVAAKKRGGARGR